MAKHHQHKTRWASKGEQKQRAKGRVGRPGKPKRGVKSTSVDSKQARQNAAKQFRQQKRQAVIEQKRIGTRSGPPKIIAVCQVTPNGDTVSTLQALYAESHSQCMESKGNFQNDMPSTDMNPITLRFPKFKQRMTFFNTPMTPLGVLDIAKAADMILFVGHAADDVSSISSEMMNLLFAQGVPSVMVVIQGLNELKNIKAQNEVKKKFGKYFNDSFPEKPRIVPLDKPQDTAQLIRWLSNIKLRSVHWRDQHAHLLADRWEYEPTSASLKLWGFVRGRGFSADNLFHLLNCGTFQIAAVTAAKDPYGLSTGAAGAAVMEDSNDGQENVLSEPTEKQESLVNAVDPDPMQGEQTWPTEEELARAEEAEKEYLASMNKTRKKKVPKGFSEYQAAWIADSDSEFGTSSDENEDEEDWEDILDVKDDDAGMNLGRDAEDADDAEEHDYVDVESVATNGDEVTRAVLEDEKLSEDQRRKERQEYLERIKESEEYREFPDEVDTPEDVPARIRFQKFRALKSFRKSPWDPKENLPLDYSRIFQFENVQRSRKRALAETEAVPVDQYVCVHLANVPASFVEKRDATLPLIGFALLRHENKFTVVNCHVRKHSSFNEPVKSKDTLIVQVGFRRFETQPVFSEHNPMSDKHKYERFLQEDKFVVASFFGPMTYRPAPVLVFRAQSSLINNNNNNNSTLDQHQHQPCPASMNHEETSVGMVRIPETEELVATGHVLSTDPDRIILKTIILSGYIYRTHKRHAVVRYMFHNPGDVKWFKPVELWTKQGKKGVIVEPLGTHGYMKCRFDTQLKQFDVVCMSLHKRMFPKWTTRSLSFLMN